MGNEEMTVSWRTLVQMACARAAEAEMEALPTPEELLALYPDMAAADRRVLSAVEAARRANRKGKRPALRTIRRVLIAAAVAVCAFFCIAMTNPSVRNAVVHIVTEWTQRDVGIHFQISGETLSELPAGYEPHYIPEEFIYQEEFSWRNSEGISCGYETENHQAVLRIEVSVAKNNSGYWMDNEHTVYNEITFRGETAYVGTFELNPGYTMVWVKDGIEHWIYLSGEGYELSDILYIAENIY